MEKINKLERVVAGWYKSLPHLPKGGQEWLAKHVWWIVLAGVIINALGIFFAVGVSFLAGLLLASFGGVGGVLLAILIVISVVLVLAFSAAMLVLSVMAIRPLRELRKRGWTLVFIILLFEVGAQVVNFVLDLRLNDVAHITDLLWSLLGLVIAGYFLFEIRGYFSAPKDAKKPEVDKK